MSLARTAPIGQQAHAEHAVRSVPRGSRSRLARALFLFYKACTANRSPACRFMPSCSEYALVALERFGTRRALSLVARRLARCRPGGPFGWDPVPEELGGAKGGAKP
jgi:putative membrane protein insertion efficiency factor